MSSLYGKLLWLCKECHMKRYLTIMKDKGIENDQEQQSALNPEAPNKNRFYSLHSRGDK